MEIIKVKNAEYARYEELLLRRDQLRKEAAIYHGLYVKEFGDLMLAVFEKQISCIRKKKLIGYYRAALNRGREINRRDIEAKVEQEMREYRQQMQTLAKEAEAARSMTELPLDQALKIRKIYHRLAKRLHPDINPATSEVPELQELWNSVTTAYRCNSLKDMEEAEMLVNRALEKLGMGCTEIEIPDLAGKIKAVEAEIRKITETDPYRYKFVLENPEAIEEQKKNLAEQEKEYSAYEAELDTAISGILESGVKPSWRMN